MKKKTICASKLNTFLANEKANDIIVSQGLETTEKNVSLVKVVLREPAFKHLPGKPFYAFVKQAGEWGVFVDVSSGSAMAVSNHQVASQTNVSGRFKINGVTYKQADTICGMPRYKAIGTDHRKRLTKIPLTSVGEYF